MNDDFMDQIDAIFGLMSGKDNLVFCNGTPWMPYIAYLSTIYARYMHRFIPVQKCSVSFDIETGPEPYTFQWWSWALREIANV